MNYDAEPAVFLQTLERYFEPAGAQADEWLRSWMTFQSRRANLRGLDDLFDPIANYIVHGLRWWEERAIGAPISTPDRISMFLCSSTDLPTRPLLHCPAWLVGSWEPETSVSGDECLTLSAQGDFQARGPAADGTWCVHHSLFDELRLIENRKSRSYEIEREGDNSLTLSPLAAPVSRRWHRIR